MKKASYTAFFSLLLLPLFAQFAPAAGHTGSSAIHKDSSVFVNWANFCTVVRGPQDISNTASAPASAGDTSMALGKAGSNGTLSLGDGGIATIRFPLPIKNGTGYDFAVFENSFSDTFLELAFVEVSSDGINFFRFPATSLTQDSIQTGTFGLSNPEKLNNLAGKYRALYGTPFDLQELNNIVGLDINNITHVRIIDVVGCIQEQYASYDAQGHKVNDPWPTGFASSGFDLDAVGVIHQQSNGISEENETRFSLFPNPAEDNIYLHTIAVNQAFQLSLYNQTGQTILNQVNCKNLANTISIEVKHLEPGIYYLRINTANATQILKFVKH